MSHPWRTVTSTAGIAAAHRFLGLSLSIIAGWLLISYLRGALGPSIIVPLVACGVIVFFGVTRYTNERLETHPWGIVIASLWRTRKIEWSNVSEVFVVVETDPGTAEPWTIFIIDPFEGGLDRELDIYLHNADAQVPLLGVYTFSGSSPVFSPAVGVEAARTLVQGFLASSSVRL